MKLKTFLFALLSMGFILTSCNKESILDVEDPTQQSINIDEAEELEYFEEEDGEVKERISNFFTFNTLNAALECTGLDAALFSGSKTVFAPSDAAFEKLGLNSENICELLDAETLSAILLYHVVDGQVKLRDLGCIEPLDGNLAHFKRERFRYSINDSRIYLRFFQRSRDFRLRIYAITDVLEIPTDNIAVTAGGVDMFSVLVQAIGAADESVGQALTDEDAKLTVFAPTNQAFIDLLTALELPSLEALVDALGQDGLTKVLLYHAVDACAFSNDLVDGAEIPTLLDETITVDLDNLSLIDKSGVPSGLVPEGLDILTSNGVVHTIDKVLLPQVILNAIQ